jgi:hypothetical protein
MTLKTHHLEILDLFEHDDDQSLKNEWISKISQRDLYSIASWLMMNLTEQSQGTEHKRSNIRDILAYYYDQMTYHNNPVPWSDKTKWFIANAVINLWPYRQLAQDPRYEF